MNLFGFRFGNNDGKFVKKSECHAAQDRIHDQIAGLKDHLDLKIDTKFDALDHRITDVLSKK